MAGRRRQTQRAARRGSCPSAAAHGPARANPQTLGPPGAHAWQSGAGESGALRAQVAVHQQLHVAQLAQLHRRVAQQRHRRAALALGRRRVWGCIWRAPAACRAQTLVRAGPMCEKGQGNKQSTPRVLQLKQHWGLQDIGVFMRDIWTLICTHNPCHCACSLSQPTLSTVNNVESNRVSPA